MVVEVRIHCRGGQGGVTAARIIGLAAVKEGLRAIAFPSFTVERRGAPVTAFVRISESDVLDRSFIYSPDYVLIFDSKLIAQPSVKAGVKEGTAFLVNARSRAEVEALGARRLGVVDASRIAMELLGAPIVSSAMCGAFASFTGLLRLGSIEEAIREVLPPAVADRNVEAAVRAYREVESWVG